MKEIYQSTDLQLKYSEAFNLIRDLPDKQRIRAENRFLLIKEFQDYAKEEAERLGRRFRITPAMEDYCDINETTRKTLYKYMQWYRKGGIRALSSAKGKRGNGPVERTILPLISEAIEPGMGYKHALDKLVTICDERRVKPPDYSTFRSIVKRHGLSDTIARKKSVKHKPIKKVRIEEETKPDKRSKCFKITTPAWIRLVDPKAFSTAIYKCGLVLPLLNPALGPEEKDRRIDEIVNMEHHPFSGGAIRIARSSMLRYISVVKKKGLDGLINKKFFRKSRRYDNILWTTLKIDMNDPLACLQDLKEIIQDSPATSPDAKEISLRFLSYCVRLTNQKVCKYKHMGLDRPLTAEELQKLEDYEVGIHKNYMRRAIAVLMANDGFTMLEIMVALGCARQTVYRWLQKFKNNGIDFIPGSGFKTKKLIVSNSYQY